MQKMEESLQNLHVEGSQSSPSYCLLFSPMGVFIMLAPCGAQWVHVVMQGGETALLLGSAHLQSWFLLCSEHLGRFLREELGTSGVAGAACISTAYHKPGLQSNRSGTATTHGPICCLEQLH